MLLKILVVSVTFFFLVFAANVRELLEEREALDAQVIAAVVWSQVKSPSASSSGMVQPQPKESSTRVPLFEAVDDGTASSLRVWVDSEFADTVNDKHFVRYDFFRPNVSAIADHFAREIDVFNPQAQDNPELVAMAETELRIKLAYVKTLTLEINRISLAAPGKFGVFGYLPGNPADTDATFVIDAVAGQLISGDVFDGTYSHTVFKTPEPGVYVMLQLLPNPTFIDDELYLEDEREA